MKQLNEEMLVNVAGGDKGDKELEAKYGVAFYEVGQYVEIYSSFLHIATKRALITGRRLLEQGYYQYAFQYVSDPCTGGCCTADQIQSC